MKTTCAAPVNSIHFDDLHSIFQGRLEAGTYYLKVAGKDATDTGRYTVRAIVDAGAKPYFVDRCSNILHECRHKRPALRLPVAPEEQ